MNLRKAQISDIKDLQELYFAVYGNSYPLPLGQDFKVMKELIEDQDNDWLVVESPEGDLVASCLFEVESHYRIGRVSGLVVHPEYKRKHMASYIIRSGMEALFKEGRVRSAYVTTRTVSLPPQVTFLNSGFRALGLSPNAHKLKEFETLTLMASYSSEVSFERKREVRVPRELKALIEITQETFPTWRYSKIGYVDVDFPKAPPSEQDEIEYEFIYAPNFVYKRFLKAFSDPWERFYPFHKPNLLITAPDDSVDVYAHFSPKDGYCTIVTYDSEIEAIQGRLKKLFAQIKDFGITYLEILVQLDDLKSLAGLLEYRFIPCALYPSMLNIKGEERDIVLLSRSLEPLDFHSLKLASCFRPHIEQYLQLWKSKFIDSLKFEATELETNP